MSKGTPRGWFWARGGGGKGEGELEKTENGKHKLQTPSEPPRGRRMTGSANEACGVIADRFTTDSGSVARGRGSLREKGRGRDRAVYSGGGFQKLKDVLTNTTTFGLAADPFLVFFWA